MEKMNEKMVTNDEIKEFYRLRGRIEAAAGYVNTTDYPSVKEICAIIGVEYRAKEEKKK